MCKKKLTSAAVLLVASAALLFAGGQGESASAEESAVTVNPAGTFPVVEEPITISVFRAQDPRVVDYEDNYQTQLLEDRTNIHVDWILVPSQQVDEKINLTLASGTDLPDVFMEPMSNELLLRYGQEGVFLPLNDYIEEYGVETKKIVADFAADDIDFLNMYTAPDDNIYGLPFVNVCKWCETTWRCWVDTRWMDGLGLEFPETVDDFRDMLVAFKTGDPNGNGKADEIPLMGAAQGWGTQVEGYLMMPFIVYNAGNGERLILDQETGEVTAAYTQPEWLEGVRYIKGLIDGGLLDPVSLTQTRQEYRVMGETEPPVVGTFLASNFQFLTLADKKYENYEAIPPLRSVDTGERQTYANIYQPFQNARFVITKECDYPAAAFRWADFQYSIENSMISRYAKEGEDWVEADPGQKGPFGDPATFQEIGQWGEPTQNSLRQMFAYLSYDVLKGLAMADNSDSYYVMRTTKYRPVSIGNSLPRFFLLPHEVDEYSELRTTLDTYVDETFARFVTGDLPLSEWDRFQSELDKIGIDRYIEMTEAAYKRQYLD